MIQTWDEQANHCCTGRWESVQLPHIVGEGRGIRRHTNSHLRARQTEGREASLFASAINDMGNKKGYGETGVAAVLVEEKRTIRATTQNNNFLFDLKNINY